MCRVYVLKLCLSREDLPNVGVQFRFAHRAVAPGVGTDVNVQHIKIPKGLLINKEPPGIMHVPTQMDLIPSKEMVGRNVNKLEARIVGRVVPNGADVASDLRGQRATDRPHVVVRIVVALKEHDLTRDLSRVEIGLLTPSLRAAVLAVVHEVADMDEQVARLAALIDPTDQRGVMLGNALERAVRPFDDPRMFGALKVEVAGEEGLHDWNC